MKRSNPRSRAVELACAQALRDEWGYEVKDTGDDDYYPVDGFIFQCLVGEDPYMKGGQVAYACAYEVKERPAAAGKRSCFVSLHKVFALRELHECDGLLPLFIAQREDGSFWWCDVTLIHQPLRLFWGGWEEPRDGQPHDQEWMYEVPWRFFAPLDAGCPIGVAA